VWSADPKESWTLAPADVFGDEVPQRKHGGSTNPRLHLQSRRYTFTASEKAPRQPAVVRKWQVKVEAIRPTR
jgi:hypothetical protein